MTLAILDKLIKKESIRRAKRFFETKLSYTLGPVDLNEMMKRGESFNIIDVRGPEDYTSSHIPNAVNLPENRWSSFEGLSKSKINIVYCYSISCLLSSRAARYFAEHDFPVMELIGGIEEWKKHNYSLETSQKKTTA